MIKNILQHQCPRCHQGKLFKYPAYNLKSFAKMHDHCPRCGQRYEIEPSFFMGAMYVSYALQVAIFITVFVAVNVLTTDAEVYVYISSIAVATLLLIPVVLRLSRSIWIHLFVKYDPSYDACVTVQPE